MKNLLLSFSLLIAFSQIFAQTSSFDWIAKDDTVRSIPVADSIIAFDGSLINKTNRNLDILIIKQSVSNPKNWPNYICAGVCYPPNQDTIRLNIDPNATVEIKYDVDVIAPSNGDVATFKVTIMNNQNPEEFIIRNFRVNVNQTSKHKGIQNQFSVYPNPVTNILRVKSDEKIVSMEVISLNGQVLLSSYTHTINVEDLLPGIYIIKITDFKGNSEFQKFIKENN